jgi:hypothetical protein
LSVRLADDRKLQAGGNDRVDEWPQAPHDPEFYLCLDMSGKQVAHGGDGQWRHLAACHPITSFGYLWLKGGRIEFVGIKTTGPDPFQPSTLDRMQPARTTQTEKIHTGLQGVVFRPAAGARTIAWEPVARRMLFIERPDEGLDFIRSWRHVWSKQCDGRVLRKMKKGPHTCILLAIDTLAGIAS